MWPCQWKELSQESASNKIYLVMGIFWIHFQAKTMLPAGPGRKQMSPDRWFEKKEGIKNKGIEKHSDKSK